MRASQWVSTLNSFTYVYVCVCVWRWFRAIKPSRIWLQTFSRQTKPQVFKYQIILSFSHSNVLSFFLSCLQRDLHAECIFTSRSNERLSADKVYDVFSFVAKPYQSFEPFGKQKKTLMEFFFLGIFKQEEFFVLNVHR